MEDGNHLRLLKNKKQRTANMGIAASVAGRVSALSAAVSGDGMLIPHLHKALPVGCLLSNEQFEKINERLIKNNISFNVPSQTGYNGQPGEKRPYLLQLLVIILLNLNHSPTKWISFHNSITQNFL